VEELVDHLKYLERNEAVAVSRNVVTEVARMMYRMRQLNGPKFDRFPHHYLSMVRMIERKFMTAISTL